MMILSILFLVAVVQSSVIPQSIDCALPQNSCNATLGCVWCNAAMILEDKCMTLHDALHVDKAMYSCDVSSIDMSVPADAIECSAMNETDCFKQGDGCLWCEGSMLALNRCATSDFAKKLTGPLYSCKSPVSKSNLVLPNLIDNIPTHISNSVDCDLPRGSCNITVGCVWCDAAKGYAVRNGCLTLGDAINVNQNILTCELPPIFMPGPVIPKNTTNEDITSSTEVSECSAFTEPDCAIQGENCFWCEGSMIALSRCATSTMAKQLAGPLYECKAPEAKSDPIVLMPGPVISEPQSGKVVVSNCTASTEVECGLKGSDCKWCSSSMLILSRCASSAFADKFSGPLLRCITPAKSVSPIKRVVRPDIPVSTVPIASECSARTETECAAQGSSCLWCSNSMYILSRCATPSFAKQYGKSSVGYSCHAPLSV